MPAEARKCCKLQATDIFLIWKRLKNHRILTNSVLGCVNVQWILWQIEFWSPLGCIPMWSQSGRTGHTWGWLAEIKFSCVFSALSKHVILTLFYLMIWLVHPGSWVITYHWCFFPAETHVRGWWMDFLCADGHWYIDHLFYIPLHHRPDKRNSIK